MCISTGNSKRTAELVLKATEGDVVLLSCHTEPGTTVTWQYRRSGPGASDRYICIDGIVVPDYAAKLLLTGDADGDYTLFIKVASVNDSGFYTCTEDAGLGKKNYMRLDVRKNTGIVHRICCIIVVCTKMLWTSGNLSNLCSTCIDTKLYDGWQP